MTLHSRIMALPKFLVTAVLSTSSFTFADECTCSSEKNKSLVAWVVAACTTFGAIVCLGLFLHSKWRSHGCCRKDEPEYLKPDYFNSGDPDDEYARIDELHRAEPPPRNEDSGENVEYLNPRVSPATAATLGRRSRFSDVLQSGFWTGNEGMAPHVASNPPRCNETGRDASSRLHASSGLVGTGGVRQENRGTSRCFDAPAAGNLQRTSRPVAFDGEGDDSGLSKLTDSMVNVFQDLCDPSNKDFRYRFLKALQKTVTSEKHWLNRMSWSESNIAQLVAEVDKDEKGSSDDDTGHPKSQTPIPKRRKSLRAQMHVQCGPMANFTEVRRQKVKSGGQCNYEIDCPRRPPKPLPRSKSLNRSCQRSILKDTWSCDFTGFERQGFFITSDIQLVTDPLTESVENKEKLPNQNSLNSSALKVQKALSLDGKLGNRKVYENVRLVVKDVEDIGFSSDFWNS